MAGYGPTRGWGAGIRPDFATPGAKRISLGSKADQDIDPTLSGRLGAAGASDTLRGIRPGLGRIEPAGGDLRTGLYVTSKVRSDPIEGLIPEGSVHAVGMPVFLVHHRDDQRSCVLPMTVLNHLLEEGHELRKKELLRLGASLRADMRDTPLEDVIGCDSTKRRYVPIGPQFFKTIRTVDDLMRCVTFLGIYKDSSSTTFRGADRLIDHDVLRVPSTLVLETQGHVEFMFNFANAELGDSIFIVPYRDHRSPDQLSLSDDVDNYGPLQFKMIATRLPRPSFMSNSDLMCGAAINFQQSGRDFAKIHDMVWSLRDKHGRMHQQPLDWYESKVPPHMTQDTVIRELVFELKDGNLLCYEVPYSPPVLHIGKVLHKNMTFGEPLTSKTVRKALSDVTAQIIRNAENSVVLYMNVYLA